MAKIQTRNGSLTGHKVTVPRSSSSVVVNNPCLFAGIMVRPGKSGASYLPVTILGIYNSADAAGNVDANRLVPRNLEITSGTQPLYTLSFDPPLVCSDGISVQISGGGTFYYQVIYDDTEA